MKIINSRIEILNAPDYQLMLNHIELAGRTCYKSEDKIKEGTAEELVKRLIKSGHESVIEHFGISVRFICDRGVSHELVRHRLCSFSQESTRYCNYSVEKFGNELTFIKPIWYTQPTDPKSDERAALVQRAKIWQSAMAEAEKAYLQMLSEGATPQEARSVLPNSLKTDIVVTANIRQWRTVLRQRCDSAAHPQMRQVMLPLLSEFIEMYPVFFKDLSEMCTRGDVIFKENGWQPAGEG